MPHLADAEPRRLFAELAAKFYAPYPETVVAVTGTNGKTSTVEMTRQIWRMSGHRSASIGTLGVTTSDDQVKTGLTTPDIVTFLNNMAGLKRMGISHVAYEASSHGLDQHRAEGVPLAAAAFTNFSRDHLDYHPTMDAYFEAKMRLFDELLPPGTPAVVWTDDPKSDEVIERARAAGIELYDRRPRRAKRSTWSSRSPTALGQTLMLEHDGKPYRLALPLIGAYQAANVLVAAGLVLATGGDWDATFSAMQRVAPVRGRLERAVISRAGVPVYIDYAHTPDALEAAIAALRPHVEGRADHRVRRRRRPRPGQTAGNGRGRRAAVGRGHRHRRQSAQRRSGGDPLRDHGRSAWRDRDRRAAAKPSPKRSASRAQGDIVLVAGKGHETGQIIGDRVLPFDDALVARECAA